ncbi:MAG: GNAT family N-acetyltransferase [Opitutales bacterium]
MTASDDEVRRRAQALSLSQPQMEMERVGFDGLPEVTLPEGYTLRQAGPGDTDAAQWCAVIGRAFGDPRDYPEWKRAMIDRADANPEHILFVCDREGTPVATASAYGDAVDGYVHYVGVLPEHAGQGLGYQVSLAVLHRFAGRGCRRAWLVTDDFRHPAIRTYWKLGFRPRMAHWSHPYRWQAVAETLGLPDLAGGCN